MQSHPDLIWVKAAPGRGGLVGKRLVLREGSRHHHITEQVPVEVPLTAYYLRRLASGELLRVPAPEPIAARGDQQED